MKYELRKQNFPICYQKGYIEIKNGISVGSNAVLCDEPICALHYHQCVELGVCIEGSGESHIEDHVYRFKKGDISCVSANVPHLSRSDENVKSVWIWVFINPFDLSVCDSAKLADILQKATSKGYCGIFEEGEHPLLAKLLYELIGHGNNDEQGAFEKSLIAARIILEMGRIGDTDNISRSRDRLGKLEPAIMYIRENYTDPAKMNGTDIAEICGLSTSHFRYLFKKHFGITLPQYINKTRLSSAVYLLRNTQKSITDIALETGFCDVSYFNRLFLREFGMTPGAMRKGYDAR